MRKHIKVKIKTLLMISIIGSILLFSESIYWQGIKFFNALVPENHQIVLQALNTRTLESENNRLTLILNDNYYELFMLVAIEDGDMIEGMRIRNEDAIKIYNTFLSYSDRYDLYKDYPEYVLNVILSQWFSGNADLAFEIINGFDEQTLNEDIYMIKAGMSLGIHDFIGVHESLSMLESSTYKDTKENLYYFLGHFMDVELNDFDLETFKAKKSFYEKKDFSGKYSYLFGNIYRLNSESQNNSLQTPRENGVQTDKSITGQVTINDQPVRGAFVYEKNFKGMTGITTSSYTLNPTDENGNFLINNIHDDFFGIGLAISWHLVYDKQLDRELYMYADLTQKNNHDFDFYDAVRFKSLTLKDDVLSYEILDSVPSEERYYYITASHTNPAYDSNSRANYQIKSNRLKGSLSIDALRLNSNFSFDFTTSGNEFEFSRFIEPLYLSDSYAFSVTPYFPSEGDRYVSNGFFTDSLSEIKIIKGQESISKGDELLSMGKVTEAISWYDKDRSLHSLKILSSLYRKGVAVEQDMEFGQKLGGVDTEKSIYYIKLLISEYGEQEKFLWSLADAYEENQDFKEVSKIYERLILLNPKSSYLHEAYGKSIINQGDFTEGIEYLVSHVSESYHLFLINNYFVLANLTEHMDDSILELFKSIKGLEEYNEFHKSIRNGKYQKAKAWLDDQKESDSKQMYQLLFDDTFRHLNTEMTYDELFNKYIETTNSIKSKNIAELLKVIKRYHNWF